MSRPVGSVAVDRVGMVYERQSFVFDNESQARNGAEPGDVIDGLVRKSAAEAALRAQEAEVLSLLRDAEAALRDLGACPDAECSVSQCLHILPRIRAHLAASEQEKPHG